MGLLLPPLHPGPFGMSRGAEGVSGGDVGGCGGCLLLWEEWNLQRYRVLGRVTRELMSPRGGIWGEPLIWAERHFKFSTLPQEGAYVFQLFTHGHNLECCDNM